MRVLVRFVIDFPDIDFTKPESLREIVRSAQPSILINAVAYTAVDKAENERDLAHAINATAPGVLAEEAKRLGALLIHYSTDYVYNGSKESPWVETDSPNPLTFMARPSWMATWPLRVLAAII